MKRLISVMSSAGVLLSLFWGCSDAKGRYLDLSTGKPIEIEKDETGAVINKETNDPVYIYVDTKKDDTIYGKTGEVINGHLVMEDGKYVFDGDAKLKMEDGEYKYKDGDYKVKAEDDGDTKTKTDDGKVKVDDGEKKVKYN